MKKIELIKAMRYKYTRRRPYKIIMKPYNFNYTKRLSQKEMNCRHNALSTQLKLLSFIVRIVCLKEVKAKRKMMNRRKIGKLTDMYSNKWLFHIVSFK